MPDDTPISEIVELDASRLDGVKSAANGTPWLLMKAQADEPAEKADGDMKDCPTCDGSGKIMEGNRDCPDCDATGKVAKGETEEILSDVTGEAIKGEFTSEHEAAAKAKLSSAEMNDLPDSAFAYIEPGGEKDDEGKTTPRSLRHFAIHDKAHADNAAARIAQGAEFGDKAEAKVKAAQAKFGEDNASKGAVQDALHGTDTPVEHGAFPASVSGVAGPVTAGVKPEFQATEAGNGLPGLSGGFLGGENAYLIPSESKLDGTAVKTAAKLFAASSVADAIEHIDEQRQAMKDALDPPEGAAATDVSSMPWETYDSATLAQVALALAHTAAAIDAIQKRESIEAMSGDPTDWCDSWDLMMAQDALDCAIGIAARLSFVEQAAAQAAKQLDLEQLSAAREGLTRTLLAGEQQIQKARDIAGSTTSKEDTLMTEVTKEELAEAILAGTDTAVQAAKSEIVDAVLDAIKNANNGGDINAADIKPNGMVDEHLNGLTDTHVTKSLTEQLEDVVKAAVAAETADLKELVVKMGKRARQGGPILNGQIPAGEGRVGDVAKSGEDLEIEGLRKQIAETGDPTQRAAIGERLTHLLLRKQAVEQFGDH